MNRKRTMSAVRHFPVRHFPVAVDPVSAKIRRKIFSEKQQFQRLLNRGRGTANRYGFADLASAGNAEEP